MIVQSRYNMSKVGYKYLVEHHGDEIKKLYLEDELNRNQIAKIFNCAKTTMEKVFKELEIPMRNKSHTVKLYKVSKFEDFIGKKINRITIHKRDINKNSNLIVSCECNPEIFYSTNGFSILNNKTKSCGCLSSEIIVKRNKDNSSHGLSKNKLYYIHYSMMNRCNNKDDKAYKYYGAKGVKICKEWNSSHDGFLDFYRWSLNNGYKEGLSIDRIDSDGNYEPSNCRWISMSENIAKRNIENSKKYKLKGGN